MSTQSPLVSSSKSLDLVTLVDSTGQKIGEMDKVAAHRGAGQLHLACSVFLFRRGQNGKGVELLIQQRSPQKIVGQWQWANTICGNVRPVETPLACAHRRLREELRIEGVDLHAMQPFYYQVACNEEFSEHEYDHLFAGWFDGEVTPNPAEAVQTDWLDWPIEVDVDKQIRQKLLATRDFAPWFRLFVLDDQIWNTINHYIQQK